MTVNKTNSTKRGIPGSVGLANLGNSCYMNCILQCLVHVEPLTNYILSSKKKEQKEEEEEEEEEGEPSSLSSSFTKDINRTNPLGSGGKVAEAYASLIKAIWSGQHTFLSPQALKNTIATFAPQFQNTRQHDAQEFLSFLIDGLHEDLNRVSFSSSSSSSLSLSLSSSSSPTVTIIHDAKSIRGKGGKDPNNGGGGDDTLLACKTWAHHLLRNDSIIVDHFQGMQRTSLTCPRCKNQSIKFDVYSSISLTLKGRTDGRPICLYSCLQNFTGEEQLDDCNAWYCSNCKVNVNAIKCVKLWTVPNILVLHLNRFTFRSSKRRGGGMLQSKIEDVVDFPVDHLNMEPFVHGPKATSSNNDDGSGGSLNAAPIYKLVGIVEHSGETADSGHYTATVRNSRDCRFYKCNDSQIGDATDNLKGSGVYLLFYKRENKGECKWGGMDRIMMLGGGKKGTGGSAASSSSSYQPSPSILDSEGFTMVVGKKKKKKSVVLL
eukprot:CAMPEP_0176504690 /NCGR_PEP_ID=MMETSP0200_2-20121128/16076_1 /TAXON_ID=947934 /ORGANISM="Chaetoceros sp., Strain GSL56" /LENGTH=489 /DNA_ID=CAMNT_0017904155 /DNA_START=100 /DNA_END=1569 /DNA_ORIENTATION=+